MCEKRYVWDPSTCISENGQYLAHIMDDSVITCDEVIDSYDEEIKTIPINFNEKNCKTQSSYILLTFLLITITLLIAVSIYCYLIKYQPKQRHFLPFHDTKLKTFCIDNVNWKWVTKLKI